MKNILILLFSILISYTLAAQDCFQDYRDQGNQAYETLKFQEAIDLFEAAKICPDNTVTQLGEIEELLTKARNGYIDAIEKARDDAIRSQEEAIKAQREAEIQARISEANRLAYLSTQELLKANVDDAYPLAFLAMGLVEDAPLSLVQESFGNMVANKYSRLLSGHTGPVINLVINGTSNKIVTQSTDYSARLWSLDGKEISVISLPDEKISQLAISSDGKRIAAADQSGNIYMFDDDGNQLSKVQPHQRLFKSLHFSPNSDILLCASRDGLLSSWNYKSNKLNKVASKEANILQTEISGTGKYILTRYSDNSINIFDNAGTLITQIEKEKHIYTASLSANENTVLTSSADGTAELWDLSGNVIQSFPHDYPVYLAKQLSKSNQIATVASDHIIRIWKSNGELLQALKAHAAKVNGLDISNDGQHILSWSADGIARIWDTQGKLKAELDQHTDEILYAEFSNSDDLIITASRDNTAKLWDVNGSLLMNVNIFDGPVRQAQFSDDDSLIGICSEDQSAIIIRNPKMVFQELKANPPQVTADQKLKYGLGTND